MIELKQSNNVDNISGLQKVQIIRESQINNIPDSNFVYLSEIDFVGENKFCPIDISEGKYKVKNKTNSSGTLFNIDIEFKHPKVRIDAENVLSKFRNNLVRLVITDNNGASRITPPGKLDIQEDIPKAGGYNGYVVKFKATNEYFQYIVLDKYATHEVSDEDIINKLWLDNASLNKLCWVGQGNMNVKFRFLAPDNTAKIKLRHDDVVDTIIQPSHYEGINFEITPADKYYFASIDEFIDIGKIQFLSLDYNIERINIPNNLILDDDVSMMFGRNGSYDNEQLEHSKIINADIVNQIYTLWKNNNFKALQIRIFGAVSDEIQAKIDELTSAGIPIKVGYN